jgi:GNAT superfamily N-acetyltransferase
MDLLVNLAEATEAEFVRSKVSAAPPETAASLGIATGRIGGGWAVAMRNDPVEYWNKALGIGVGTPISAELVDVVAEFYRSREIPMAVIQIAPAHLPVDWDDIRLRHGLVAGAPWVKLGAAVDELKPDGSPHPTVEAVGEADADEWAEVTLRGLGTYEDRLLRMVSAGAPAAGFHPFAVRENGRFIAGATLFVNGTVGSLNATGTLPRHRRKGAQRALIAARVEAARRIGCRWVIAEAALPAAGEVNPSLRNLERIGLRRLYVRQNWIWRNPARA